MRSGSPSGSDATMSAMVTAASDWRQAASASAILAARPQASRHWSGRYRAAAALPDLVARVERRPAVHRLDHLQQRDLVRGPGQPEAAARTGGGGEHAGPHQGLQLLSQVGGGQVVVLGQLRGRRRAARAELGERRGGVQDPLGAFRQLHAC